MKKHVAILLALAAVLTFSACGKGAETDTDTLAPQRPLTPYEEAVAYIEVGELENAYYALRELAEDGDEEAGAKLAEFSHGYLCRTVTDKNGKTETTVNTYSDEGELVLSQTTYHDGSVRVYECTYSHYAPVSECTTYPNGDTLERTYTYDPDGRVRSVSSTSSGGYSYEYSYEYDSQGRTVRETFSDSDGERSTTEYTYDGGRLMREVHTYALGETDVYEYSYDASGNRTHELRTYSGGLADEYSFSYDGEGHLICETVEYSDGKTESYAYVYSDGRLTREEHTFTDGSSEVYEYTYSEGRLALSRYTAEGESSEISYTYDGRGNTETEKRTASDGAVRTTEYSGYTVFYRGDKKA